MSADPTLNHPAVKLYRDIMRFCPNAGRRSDIAITVKDLNLWKEILEAWKAKKWNPLTPQWMLSEYERRAKHTKRSVCPDEQSSQRQSVHQHSQAGLPIRRDSELPTVQPIERDNYRRRDRTLEDIVAQAMSKARNPTEAR